MVYDNPKQHSLKLTILICTRGAQPAAFHENLLWQPGIEETSLSTV